MMIKLLELINTINLNEYQKKINNDEQEEVKELDPLDILSDLKGDDNTVVAGAKDFTDSLKKVEKLEDEDKKEIEKNESDDIDHSFYSENMSFSQEDFADIQEDSKIGGIVIKILIVIIFIAIIAGIVLFLNDFLKLGWF